ncbi:T9SS type A sorting domain-containing protein [bacterium]|nr:T9SS type A sorting domain-containing protein [bacterium]
MKSGASLYSTAAILAILLFLPHPSFSQDWIWRWDELDTRLSPAQTRPNSYRLLYGSNQSGSPVYGRGFDGEVLRLLVDTDPSLAGVDWELVLVTLDGLPFWEDASFWVDGPLLHADISTEARELPISYEYNYLASNPSWEPTEGSVPSIVRAEDCRSYDHRYGDVNGDGLLDWVFAQSDSHHRTCDLVVVLRDTTAPWGWTTWEYEFETVFTGLTVAYYGFQLAQIDDDPAAELVFLFAEVWVEPGEPSIRNHKIIVVDDSFTESPTRNLLSLYGEDYANNLFSFDLTGDGVDEFLLYKDHSWSACSIEPGNLLVPFEDYTQPADIVAINSDPTDPTRLFATTRSTWIDTIDYLENPFIYNLSLNRWVWSDERNAWHKLGPLMEFWNFNVFETVFRFDSVWDEGSQYQTLHLIGYTRQNGYRFPFTSGYVSPADPLGTNWSNLPNYSRGVQPDSLVAIGNMDNNPEPAMMLALQLSDHSAFHFQRKEFVDGDWLLRDTYELPRNPGPVEWMFFSFVDQDSLLDLMMFPSTCYLRRPLPNGGYYWMVTDPFEGVSIPTDLAAIADVDGDGDDDFIFRSGDVLFNDNTLSAQEHEPEEAQPGSFVLHPPTPNPFNPTTTITLDLPRAGHVRVAMYDLLGRQVTVLRNQNAVQGRHTLLFDGSGLATGTYLVRATLDGSQDQVRKVVLVK